jgi:beta-galactosidase
LDASAEVGELPELSILMTLDADYDNMMWYGRGPEETYPDRNHAKIGVYRTKVADNMAKYLVPQECGNKTEVRYAEITDHRGRGYRIEGDNLSLSVLPYTPHEIDCATHPNHLPPVQNTYVRVGLAQMGIAGDDTWGAKTHPEYCIDNSKPLEVSFSFRPI